MTYIPLPRPRPFAPVGKSPSLKHFSILLIISLLISIYGQFVTSEPYEPSAQIQNKPTFNLDNLPIAFVPNVGQNDAQIRYQAQGLGGMLFFTPDQIVLTLPNGANDQADAAVTSHAGTVVRLRFVDANTQTKIESAESLPGVVNYMLGDDPSKWHTNVPTYKTLRYQALYPGIDLHYDGTAGGLKGTYFVAAGADPQQIRWRYEGATAVRVDGDGNLVATLSANGTEAARTLVEQAPVAWQTINERQVPVEARYTITNDNTIGFTVGTYDRALPLVVDPLVYGSHLGGAEEDSARSVAVDATGAAYITGRTNSPAIQPFLPGYDKILNNIVQSNPATDAFVTKLSSNGTPVYTTYLGGSADDIGYGIAVDSDGSAYVIGETKSGDFPQKKELPAGPSAGVEMFITKLYTDGTDLVYSTYLGGKKDDIGRAIAVHSTGAVYITGSTKSADLETTANAPYPIKAGDDDDSDAYVAKLTQSDEANVTIDYATYLGSGGNDNGYGIAVDGNYVYVTGSTDPLSPTEPFPTTSKGDQVYGGGQDGFVTQLYVEALIPTPPTALTPPVYSTYFGGTDLDEIRGIALHDGYAYITGWTESSSTEDFPVSSNTAFQKELRGDIDAFVAKLDLKSNKPMYATYFGGIGTDRGIDIAVDDTGTVYITGDTTPPGGGTKLPTTATADSKDYLGGNNDAFVAMVDVNIPGTDSLLYSSYIGSKTNGSSGSPSDIGRGIALDDDNNIVVVGDVAGSFSAPTLTDSYNGGGLDAFVIKIKKGFVNDIKLSLAIVDLPPPVSANQIGLGQIFKLQINADPGATATDINKVQAYLDFDEGLLEVVDHTGVITTTIAPATGLTASTNTANNGTGKIDFIATLNAAATEPFPVAYVYFRTKQATTAKIQLEASGTRISDLYEDGARVKAELSHATVTIFNGIWLNAKVAVEPGSRTHQSIKLFRNKTSGVKLINPGGITVTLDNIVTNSSGSLRHEDDPDNLIDEPNNLIKVTGILTSTLPKKPIMIRIKGDNTLTGEFALPSIQFIDREIDLGTLRAGDANGDDLINGADVSFLAPFFSRATTDPNAAYADFDKNAENHPVTTADVSALTCNFLRTGGDTLGKTCPRPTPTTRAATAVRPTLSLKAAQPTVKVGEIFTATLELDLDTATADSVGAYLNFDPRYLEVVDSAGRPATRISINTALFSSAIYNTVDPQRGQIGLSVSRFSRPWLSGKVTIATMRFRAKQAADSTQLTFAQEQQRYSDTFEAGYALQAERSGVDVSILEQSYAVFIPYAQQ